ESVACLLSSNGNLLFFAWVLAFMRDDLLLKEAHTTIIVLKSDTCGGSFNIARHTCTDSIHEQNGSSNQGKIRYFLQCPA
ncbi:hypothetical protein ACJX0J_027916, partial [Zea mays]